MKQKRRITFIALITVVSVGLAGCGTTTSLSTTTAGTGATASQKAQAALATAEKAVPFIVGPAVTGWLLMQKDVAKQQRDAAYVYSGATALNSAATGEVLTLEKLQALIGTFTAADPRYAQLAQLLSSEYGQLYPLFNIAGSNPVKFFTAVALAAQNAAQPFLAPKT